MGVNVEIIPGGVHGWEFRRNRATRPLPSLADWVTSYSTGNGAASIVSAGIQEGPVYRFTATANNTNAVISVGGNGNVIPWSPGLAVPWSANISASGTSVLFGVQFYNGGTLLSTDTAPKTITSSVPSSPNRLFMTSVPAPSGTTRVALIVAASPSLSNSEFITVNKVNLGDSGFFDGDSPDTSTSEFSWVGGAGISESIETRLFAPSGKGVPGDVITWRASEGASPVDIGSTMGTFGTSSVTANLGEETRFLTDNNVRITRSTLDGEIVGTASNVKIDSTLILQNRVWNSGPLQIEESRGTVSFDVDTPASLLNTVRIMPPVSEQPLSSVFQDYVSAVTEKISVDYIATLDPIRIYRGWEGNVWQMLLSLSAANNVEMVTFGNTLTIRDIGQTVFEVEENDSVVIDLSNNVEGRHVLIRYYNYSSVSSGEIITNYSQNPSLETNSVDWATTSNGVGSFTAGRVSN